MRLIESLLIKAIVMNKTQIKKLEAMKKKVGCPLTDCGKYFTFTINENTLLSSDESKRVYTGACSKCHKTLKLKLNQIGTFQTVYGKTNEVITKSMFDDLFEIDEKK